jgi:hypothetical protein
VTRTWAHLNTEEKTQAMPTFLFKPKRRASGFPFVKNSKIGDVSFWGWNKINLYGIV